MRHPPILHQEIRISNFFLDQEINDETNLSFNARLLPIANEESQLAPDKAGQAEYMSPETLLGGMISTKSDIYSFGILFWQTFSERFPLADMKTKDGKPMISGQICVHVVAKNARPNLKFLKENTPKEIINLIKKCWEHLQKNRPNIQEVISIIETLMD